MTKKITLLSITLLVLCASIACADNERPIAVTQLPAAAQRWLQTHFAEAKVVLATVEGSMLGKQYEVAFANGDHIEFDGKGNWKEIDCPASAVPASAIPTPLVDYVKTHYPQETVVKIERDGRAYELKLSSRVELKFNAKFQLIGIDL